MKPNGSAETLDRSKVEQEMGFKKRMNNLQTSRSLNKQKMIYRKTCLSSKMFSLREIITIITSVR